MNTKKMNKLIYTIIFLNIIASCSLAPGMHMSESKNWFSDENFVYIESLDRSIKIENINNIQEQGNKNINIYRIGVGDQIAVSIWGLPDIFPIVNVTPDQNLRRVDSNGNIFFPYAGLVKAKGKTQDQLRNDLTLSLSNYFNEPQVDVTISRFNSQQVFVLGAVTRPQKINITDVRLSLSDAIGNAYGLNENTAGHEVFIIRQEDSKGSPRIYFANMKSPSYFIDAGKFYLSDNDIIYINSSSTARWNKVISQFFPFSSFLNSVDNLIED